MHVLKGNRLISLRKFPSLRTHMHQDRYAIIKFIRVLCGLRMTWSDVFW